MGSIIKKLNREPHTCEMCKKFKIGDRYIYLSFAFKEHSSSKLVICKPCAKREHGPKNKTPLEDLFQ